MLKSRYSRQIALKQVGIEGQNKLELANVGILGCGALGTNIFELLVRSGIGTIVIADSDKIELTNLQRQRLFTENDVGQPKVEVAKKVAEKINSNIEIITHCKRVDLTNFADIFRDCQIVLDATDNFETRFMINKECMKLKMPWVFSGITETSGQCAFIYPPKTPCLNCIIPSYSVPESLPNVKNNGILPTIASSIASISVTKAIRFLISGEIESKILYYDIWNEDFRNYEIESDSNCQYCKSA